MRTAGAIVNRMTEKPTPILFISDSPSSSSGLGRICRDITTRVHEHLSDIYRVGVLGWGGPGSRRFGFTNYVIEGMQEWAIPTLPEVWDDFAGNESGIVFTIWDLSRLDWIAQPRLSESSLLKNPALRQWLIKRPFKLFGYAPIDGSGPNDKLSFPLMRTALGFDTLLGYGEFGEDVLRRTIGDEESSKRHLSSIPHGVDRETFYEMHRPLCRHMFFQITGGQQIMKDSGPVTDDTCLIGICATNQDRKNFALGIETAAIIARDRKVRLWLHTDAYERFWSLPALLVDYGILDRAIISLTQIADEQLAEAFSACDLTLGIGPEGFGLPLAENLACGTPVITGSYAGAADFVPKDMQVDPVAFHYQGSFGTKRPVYNAADWAAKANEWIGKRTSLDPRYDWKNLWINEWEPWFREATK